MLWCILYILQIFSFCFKSHTNIQVSGTGNQMHKMTRSSTKLQKLQGVKSKLLTANQYACQEITLLINKLKQWIK